MTVSLEVIVQGVIVTLLLVIGYFFKQTLAEIKGAIRDQRCETDELRKEFTDMKSSLPMTYVLREDYIRTMADFGNKLDRLLAANGVGKKDG